MKRFKISKELLVLSAGMVLSLCTNNAAAQEEAKQCNGKTYIYGSHKVYRENMGVMSCSVLSASTNTVEFVARPKSSINDVYKELLEADRLRELDGKALMTTFCTDATGKVKYVEFLFNETPFLTVEEIEKLETRFLGHEFTIRTSGDEPKNVEYKFSVPCLFSKLQ